jgi:hypothetical protein
MSHIIVCFCPSVSRIQCVHAAVHIRSVVRYPSCYHILQALCNFKSVRPSVSPSVSILSTEGQAVTRRHEPLFSSSLFLHHRHFHLFLSSIWTACLCFCMWGCGRRRLSIPIVARFPLPPDWALSLGQLVLLFSEPLDHRRLRFHLQ